MCLVDVLPVLSEVHIRYCKDRIGRLCQLQMRVVTTPLSASRQPLRTTNPMLPQFGNI